MTEQNPETETRLALVERAVDQYDIISQHFSEALEKITQVCTSIEKLLAVHDTKINTHFMEQEKLSDRLEAHIKSSVDMQINFKTDLAKINTTQEDISKKLDEVQRCFIKHKEQQEERITKLERLKWVVTGASLIIAAIVSALIKFNGFTSIIDAFK